MSTPPPTPSPWLVPIRWCSGGFVAGAASVGLAWGILGARVDTPIEPHRVDTILPQRPPPETVLRLPEAETTLVPAMRALSNPGPDGQPVSPTPQAAAPAFDVPSQEAVDSPPPPPDPAPPAAPQSRVLRINVNSATVAELDLLPGIGPALAQRIIDERTRNGRFVSLRDLERVPGIGPKTAEKLQGLVVFE